MRASFKIKLTVILLFGCSFFVPQLHSQNLSPDSLVNKIGDYLLYRNHDTNYIQGFGGKVALKLLLTNKYNYFRIKDRTNGAHIRYRPARDANLGIGVSYKWFALDLTVGLGFRNNSELENSKAFDFQGRIYSSKQFIAATLQYYYGYLMTQSSGYTFDDAWKTREDIRNISFGLQYLYALNYDKFSLKAPFVFNEIQRKSAGSVILGASFSLFILDADSSMVPTVVTLYANNELYLTDLNVITVAISGGYMYSFIYKEKYFATLGLIPGISLNFGDYQTVVRDSFNPNVSFKINTMNAIGYNGRHFFGGLQFIGDIFDVRVSKELRVTFGYGRVGFFFGYRL